MTGWKEKIKVDGDYVGVMDQWGMVGRDLNTTSGLKLVDEWQKEKENRGRSNESRGGG